MKTNVLAMWKPSLKQVEAVAVVCFTKVTTVHLTKVTVSCCAKVILKLMNCTVHKQT